MTNSRMTYKVVVLVVGIWSLGFPLPIARAEVTAEPSDRGVVVKIDGKLFTEYLNKAGHSPAMWPVIGPTGKPVTRAYPFKPAETGGTLDHPHHQSLWFTHDKVNGIDFWAANHKDDKGDSGPHIGPIGSPMIQNRDSTAEITTHNDWMNGKERLCQDERKVVCGTGPGDSRWIDYTITVKASDGDVTFGDTKEGTFALRVADSMRVDAKRGGRIVNSEGKENAAAWGMPARWVDYTGPVDGETVGICVMSHPKNFRPLPRWHVRTYGLFAANLFGQKDFPHPEAAKQGAYTIKNGDSITVRYLVLLHRGKTNAVELNRAFDEFAKK